MVPPELQPLDAGQPEGFVRVTAELARLNHPRAPKFLAVAARTAQEAADALGVAVGQIAKSVIFRRKADDAAVLVVTSGDRRVDEAKVAAIVGPLGRADAAFVKAKTGFTIGGVAPLAHLTPPVTLIDRDLFRFNQVWAAAGHPNGVFPSSPAELEALTGAPVAEVVQAVTSPCADVCRMNPATGLCDGCLRTLDEIAAWGRADDDTRRAVLQQVAERRLSLAK